MSARPLPVPVNPALLRHADQRRQHLGNRIADTSSRFAGSRLLVTLHILWFAAWIILGVHPGHQPAQTLTGQELAQGARREGAVAWLSVRA